MCVKGPIVMVDTFYILSAMYNNNIYCVTREERAAGARTKRNTYRYAQIYIYIYTSLNIPKG